MVWHSHDLQYPEQIKVAVSEADMFARYFGYHLSSGPMSQAAMNEARGAAILYATSAGIPIAEAEAYAEMLSWSAEGRALGQAAAEMDELPA